MRTRAILGGVLAACLSWFLCGSALAQSEEYMRLSTAGAAASQAGRHEEAYALFQQAHAVFPNARSSRALGATAFQLRHYRSAIEHYEAALSDERRALTPEQRSQAQSELAVARRLVGRLRVTVQPEDAVVTIDDEPAEGEVATLDPGAHTVAASRAGFEEQRRTVQVRSGEESSIALTLVGAATPTIMQPGPTTIVEVNLQEPVLGTTADSGFVTLGGVSLGLGISLLAVGVVSHVVGEDHIRNWNKSVNDLGCTADGMGHPSPSETDERCLSLYNTWANTLPWAYVGYIAGGALTITGMLLLLLAPQVPARSTDSLSCGDGPGEIGVMCRGTF